MRCSHNYVYTQGHFYCTKCGHKTYGRSFRKKHSKKIGVGIGVGFLAIIVAFLFVNDIIEINQENLEKSVQNLPKELPEISLNLPEIPMAITKPILSKVEEVKETTVSIMQPKPSSVEQAKENINYINQIRLEKGRSPISFDQRAYELALARVKDTLEYNYFDHTNPITGSCPDNMKTIYGFSSNEFVAENLAGGIYGPNSAVDLWMTSQGHRYNLLFLEHNAGATVCQSGNCVFLGVNNAFFGQGCHTGEEGEAWHQSMGKCTDDQLAQLDMLNQKYDNLSKEYDKFPKIVKTQAEYQRAMKMYNELQSLYNQIENFKC